jgi:DNA-binding NtrC family response regulator
MPKKILIVDDEEKLCEQLDKFFGLEGFQPLVAHDGQSALELIRATEVEMVLLDLRLPDMNGMEVLQVIKAEFPSTAVVIITAHGDVDTAVNAIQLRADHFVLKPVNLKTLLAVVQRVLDSYRSQQEVAFLRGRIAALQGEKAQKLILPPEVMKTVELLAENTDTNVLILGETGTGKGMVANAIHELGPRRGKPLVDLNCAGLGGNMLESELFGHEKGAFTDAKKTKRGLFEVAHGGTLFLDEVGDTPLEVQAKLLKVLEDQRFRRLGGTATIDVDVRLITATNQDIERQAEQGTFRRDLYYRLSVMPVHLPPLKERRDEIIPLSQHFVREYAARQKKALSGCSREAESLLQAYAWPGNVRELRNVLERAVLLCDAEAEEILPRHLPENLRSPTRIPRYVEGMDYSLEAVEQQHIQQVLSLCDRNRTRAAQLLGIHRTTLLAKIAKYGIEK